MAGFHPLSKPSSRGFTHRHEFKPMRGRGFKKFTQNIVKKGKKFVKDIPTHIEKYNQIKGQIEGAYDQYQGVKDSLPDFVKDNKFVKTASSNIEMVADKGRLLRDKTDSLAEFAQSLPQEGRGLKLAGLEGSGLKLAGLEGRGLKLAGRGNGKCKKDPIADLRKQLLKVGTSEPLFNRSGMLTHSMDLCDLKHDIRNMCKDYCRLHGDMSIGEVAVLPFSITSKSLNRRLMKQVAKQVGTGKKLNSSIKSVADVAKILAPLIALL